MGLFLACCRGRAVACLGVGCLEPAFKLVFLYRFFERRIQEWVIFAELGPWPAWYEGEVYKAPMHLGHAAWYAQVIAHGGRDVDACALVGFVAGARSAKHILPVICAEGATVFLILMSVLTPEFPSLDYCVSVVKSENLKSENQKF